MADADLQPNAQQVTVNNSPPKRKIRVRSKRKPKGPASTFILDSSNCRKLFAENTALQSTLKNKTLCHKFIIQNLPIFLSKKIILQAFTEQVLPNLIIPMNIEVANNKNVIFYCTNCVPAIENLIRDNLILKFTRKVNKVKEQVQLNVTLVVAVPGMSLNAAQILKSLLRQRMSTEKPVTAHLHNLAKLPGWNNKIFLNFNCRLALNVLLHCIKERHPKILELQYNSIQSLRGWCNYYEVDAVDLSNNQISTFEDLGPLLKMDLKRINLQENPIRKQFRDQKSFNKKLRELFPNALIIETVNTSRSTKLIPSDKNQEFMSEDAIYLVDQFMEHYFNFYDNPRTKRYLEDMYHKDAIFSLTSTIIDEPGGLCPVSERFKHHAHNLLDDNSKKDFVTGPGEIIRKICYLPNVEHDHVSFTVDIPYYVENDIILFSISGAFRQGRIYMFNRTFLLKAARNGEYQIKNDFLHVTNKLVGNRLFDEMFTPLKFNLNIGEKLPFIAQNNAQKDGMTVVFIEITKLHVQYARDMLEKGHWNMKKALELYVYDLRFDNIPSNCFMQEEIKQIVFNCLPAIKMGMNVHKVSRILENMKCLTEDKYVLQPGENNKILNKCIKDEIRKMLQREVV